MKSVLMIANVDDLSSLGHCFEFMFDYGDIFLFVSAPVVIIPSNSA
jgi:hypothetical protein